MKYMGSKDRIAKYILPIMLKYKSEDQWWVEPFVGGANMIDKVEGKRIGSDSNKYVIDALMSIRDYIEYLPKNNLDFTEEDYKSLRLNEDYEYKGYAGFAFSYAGKWLGGWCRDKQGKRDYVKEAYNNAVRQSPKLQGVELICSSYDELEIPINSIIYCDPPYKDTTKYSNKQSKEPLKSNSFDHELFWQWCRDKSKEGYTVFISEYNAPDDFECVWQKDICSSLTKETGEKKGTEKLFRFMDT